MDENEETIEAAAIDYTELTTTLVAAYVSNNHVQPSEIATLIASTHAALTWLGNAGAPAAPAVDKPKPAQIRKSIKPDALISFIDGKTYKTLKGHLTSRGFDPRGYRDRYGLPADYPMVTPSYAERRSAIAKAISLGKPGARRST